jgi:hypothetical protein
MGPGSPGGGLGFSRVFCAVPASAGTGRRDDGTAAVATGGIRRVGGVPARGRCPCGGTVPVGAAAGAGAGRGVVPCGHRPGVSRDGVAVSWAAPRGPADGMTRAGAPCRGGHPARGVPRALRAGPASAGAAPETGRRSFPRDGWRWPAAGRVRGVRAGACWGEPRSGLPPVRSPVTRRCPLRPAPGPPCPEGGRRGRRGGGGGPITATQAG